MRVCAQIHKKKINKINIRRCCCKGVLERSHLLTSRLIQWGVLGLMHFTYPSLVYRLLYDTYYRLCFFGGGEQ